MGTDYERKQLELDEVQYQPTQQRITLANILSEHELKCAALHEPDAADKLVAGLSFVAACILCVVVVLFG